MSSKIILTGITSFRNHGVEALVVSTVEQLRLRLTRPVFKVLDRSPEYDRHQCIADDVEFAQDHSIRPLYASRMRRLLNRLLPGGDSHARATIEELRSADLVIASGGDVFCSEYGHRSLLSHLHPLKIAQKHGVATMMHAQSIGPFSNAADREAFLAVARQTQAITVREQASHHYLTHDLGLAEERCHLVADPAFLLHPTAEEEGEALFRHFRHRADRPTVALGISQAICHWMETDKEAHIDTWLEIIRWLRASLDANVILIPHVQEISPDNDDQVLGTALLRQLQYDPAVKLAGGALSAHDFKALISRCDFLVAERMHAAIAGLSTAVPTLVVGYSVKARGILTDLLGEQMTQERALVSIQEFLHPGQGLTKVQDAWSARDGIRQQLEASLPQIRRRAGRAFDLIQRQVEPKALQNRALLGFAPSPLPHQIPVPR